MIELSERRDPRYVRLGWIALGSLVAYSARRLVRAGAIRGVMLSVRVNACGQVERGTSIFSAGV